MTQLRNVYIHYCKVQHTQIYTQWGIATVSSFVLLSPENLSLSNTNHCGISSYMLCSTNFCTVGHHKAIVNFLPRISLDIAVNNFCVYLYSGRHTLWIGIGFRSINKSWTLLARYTHVQHIHPHKNQICLQGNVLQRKPPKMSCCERISYFLFLCEVYRNKASCCDGHFVLSCDSCFWVHNDIFTTDVLYWCMANWYATKWLDWLLSIWLRSTFIYWLIITLRSD